MRPPRPTANRSPAAHQKRPPHRLHGLTYPPPQTNLATHDAADSNGSSEDAVRGSVRTVAATVLATSSAASPDLLNDSPTYQGSEEGNGANEGPKSQHHSHAATHQGSHEAAPQNSVLVPAVAAGKVGGARRSLVSSFPSHRASLPQARSRSRSSLHSTSGTHPAGSHKANVSSNALQSFAATTGASYGSVMRSSRSASHAQPRPTGKTGNTKRKAKRKAGHRVPSPPLHNLLTSDEALFILARFTRARVVLAHTVNTRGALAARVAAQVLHEEALETLRAQSAKRSLARFLATVATAWQERQSTGEASLGATEGTLAVKDILLRGGANNGTPSLLTMARRLEKEREIIAAAFQAAWSRQRTQHLRALRVFTRAVRTIERAWRRTPRYRQLAVDSTWRRAGDMVVRHETLERRDLARRHMLWLVQTHQACYNAPVLLDGGVATRKADLTQLTAGELPWRQTSKSEREEEAEGEESLAMTLADRKTRLELPPSPNSPGSGAAFLSAFERALQEEDDIRRYERRLFFSKEERELLQELDLLDVEPEEIRLRRLQDVNPAGEEAAWVDSAEQVKMFDRLLRGMSAEKNRVSRPRPPPHRRSGAPSCAPSRSRSPVESLALTRPACAVWSPNHTAGHPNPTVAQPNRANSTWSAGSSMLLPTSSPEHTNRLTFRTVRMRSLTAEADRARIPFLLLTTLKEKGQLGFTSSEDGGVVVVTENAHGGSGVGTAQMGPVDGNKENEESSTDSEAEALEEEAYDARLQASLNSDAKTRRWQNHKGRQSDSSAHADAPSRRGFASRAAAEAAVLGAIPLPPAVAHATTLSEQYAAVAAARCGDRHTLVVSSADAGVLSSSSADDFAFESQVAPVAMGGTTAALKVSGRCDWVSESYLNPLAQPVKTAAATAGSPQASSPRKAEGSDWSAVLQSNTDASDPAPSDRESRRFAAETEQRVFHGDKTHLKRHRQRPEEEILLRDLLTAAFSSV